MPEFTSPEDLREQIEGRLTATAAEDLAPWCKLANVVFRSTEVEDTGQDIHVTARVRSDEAAHALENLRVGGTRQAGAARFTWAGRSRSVRVASMKSTTTSARSKNLSMVLATCDQPYDAFLDMSVSGHSADDLTEAALRSVLFGERHPLEEQHLGFIVKMADPPRAVARGSGGRRSDKTPGGVADRRRADRLGASSTVTAFRLGASVRGVRRLTVAWEPRRRYSNERPPVRRIEGHVRL